MNDRLDLFHIPPLPLVGAILACLAFVVQIPSKVYYARHSFLAERVVELISIQRCWCAATLSMTEERFGRTREAV